GGGGKHDDVPAPSALISGPTLNAAKTAYETKFRASKGDTNAISVHYSYVWEPDEAAIAVWQKKVEELRAKLTDELLEQRFQRERELLTQGSKIRARPANDLRQEERFEVMNRLVSHLFAQGENSVAISPVEIEYFHHFLESQSLFVTVHPAWLRPRNVRGIVLRRSLCPVTVESEPAPLGSSLGWMLQMDGDARRNAFLNSPWVRVCIPIRRGKEDEAVAWLAKHFEGEARFGYDPSKGPLKNLLEGMRRRRKVEKEKAPQGPEAFSSFDDELPKGFAVEPQTVEELYPLVGSFEVVVPTEGFVYDV